MGKKVLLIEYEPRYVERLRRLLSSLGYSVINARDGEGGLAAFSSDRFDLVILPGMLPRLSSPEVLREIRKRGGATAPPALLMVTGYKGTNPKADAQKIGAFDILVRPFTDEALLEAVGKAMETADLGAKTIRVSTAELAPEEPRLTSSDIFSDVLEDLGREASRREPPPKAPRPDEEVERRLRDTLSEVLGPGGSGAAVSSAPSAAVPKGAAGAPSARRSAGPDIDRLISDTLSGLSIPVRPKPAPAPPPEPRAPAAGEPAAAVPARSEGLGEYEILERIASGGMAELHKAKRRGVEGFQKIVAIKKILPHLADNEEFLTMFADEAKLAAQLNHSNIIHIYDLGRVESGGYFIAMEYVEGQDLRSILQSARELDVPLPVPLAVYIGSKVASALDYAHRRRDAEGHELGIVHRDVSPPNILISYEGDIKLCDFGIAKAASKASQTQSGALKGKLQYMSPEQAWGKAIDQRSDLFSLGSVLYEMLTGEKLFSGDSDLTVLEKVRSAEVSSASAVNGEVPKDLDAIVLKALAREPENRYASAADLLRDLESVLYSYSPAPGSADVAIYLHRLQAEEEAVAEVKVRSASVAEVTPPPKQKSKAAPISRKPAAAPPKQEPAPALARKAERRSAKRPASGVYGAILAEKRNRAPLYAMIAVAVVALGAAIPFAVRRAGRAPRVAVTRRAAPAPSLPPASISSTFPESLLTPVSAESGPIDPKALEAEVERQLAAKRKELEKNLQALAEAAPKEKSAEATPLPQPTEALVASAEPTAAPTEPPMLVAEVPTPIVAPPREPELVRGDLVGPGPGVVEPTLLSQPRVVYPALARQQRVSGRVIVLVLVDEDGNVSEARLQQGIVTRTGVNEAVVDAVRKARFRPATKNGVSVKMWRTVVVDVKP